VLRERRQTASTWLIGYGNPHRRDDGLGRYVVDRLCDEFHSTGRMAFCSLHQLDPVLVEELQLAELIILVDATVEDLEGGVRWTKVRPGIEISSWATHHLKPSTLLGLLEAFYHRSPPTWLVSVQGSDFGFGEGLSPETKEKADRARVEIAQFCKKEIDKEWSSINDGKIIKVRGEENGNRNRHPRH
jgi:hydrogenase maturation protease